MKLDYYNGIEGDTLRLASESTAELRDINALFSALGQGSVESVDLAERFNARAGEIQSIRLARVDRRDFREPEVTMPEPGRFEWRADPLDIARYARLIDGLVEYVGAREAYQILTSGAGDGIAVEVSAPRLR